MTSFAEFLQQRLETGGFSTEDALASFLPLVREVLDAHSAGAVAPLEGIGDLHVDGVRIWFEEARRAPQRGKLAEVRRLLEQDRAAVEIVTESRRTTDVDDGQAQRRLEICFGSDQFQPGNAKQFLSLQGDAGGRIDWRIVVQVSDEIPVGSHQGADISDTEG